MKINDNQLDIKLGLFTQEEFNIVLSRGLPLRGEK